VTRVYISALSVLSILFLGSCAPATDVAAQITEDLPPAVASTASTVEVTNYFGSALEILDVSNLSLMESRARTAAVKVESLLGSGHGSGSYMIAYGQRVVVTAAHVVEDATTMRIVGRAGESVVGRVVFRDDPADIAFLVVPEMKSRTAIRYRPHMSYDERLIGTKLTYTGFPSHHDLLTIRGYVAALERSYIVINMFGWFGSSGSGVFDHRGRLVGVVSGIDVGRYMIPLPLEDIVWVAPTSSIDHETLRVRILTADPVGVIRSFPGAMAPRRGEVRR
jgi:S1-C subfamily serine protease